MQQIATRQAAKLERTFAFVLNKLNTHNNLLFSEHTYTRTFETYCYEEKKNCNGVKNIGSILKGINYTVQRKTMAHTYSSVNSKLLLIAITFDV